MTDFPEYLREPIRRGFSETATPVWRENPTEMGAPVRELLYDSGPAAFKVTWNLDALEYYAFDNWFKWYATQGTAFFNIDLLCSLGVVPHEVQFIKNPVYKVAGKRTLVTAQLKATFKLYDTLENTDDFLELLQDLFDSGIERPTDNLNDFSNFMRVTLPDMWSPFL